MTGVTRDEAVAASLQILAATVLDKAKADRHGGDPVLDAAHAAAADLNHLVCDTGEDT